MKMINALTYVCIVAAFCNTTAFAQGTTFKVCKSTYALCTTAKCAVEPNENLVACNCDVRTDEYSVGEHECGDVKTPTPGDTLKSRYHPIKSFVACSNKRQWANCLDMNCTVDSNPATATCQCELTQSSSPYVITTDSYTGDTCTTGIISSATVDSVLQVTEFLKSSDNLQPFDFKVLNVQSK